MTLELITRPLILERKLLFSYSNQLSAPRPTFLATQSFEWAFMHFLFLLIFAAVEAQFALQIIECKSGDLHNVSDAFNFVSPLTKFKNAQPIRFRSPNYPNTYAVKGKLPFPCRLALDVGLLLIPATCLCFEDSKRTPEAGSGFRLASCCASRVYPVQLHISGASR